MNEKIREIAVWSSGENARVYEFEAEIPAGQGRAALLSVVSVRAAAGAPGYELETPAGWSLLGTATSTTTNRRYVSACWAMPEPAAGKMRVTIEGTRQMAGMVAYLGLVEEMPGEAVSVVGPAGELTLDGPIDRDAVVAVTARPGSKVLGGGEPLGWGKTDEANESTGVVGAWFVASALNNKIWAAATEGGLISLLAVPLVVEGGEEPEEPSSPEWVREVSVVVREIPPGGSHEVRHVRPGEIVMGERGIDWGMTPYTAYILVNSDDVATDQ